MKKLLEASYKGWMLGLTAWALVYTREVPTALAQAPIETDCSTDLDQPDTTYILSANTAGNCIIAADNIILDGQNLYTVMGDIRSTTTATVSFTVRNVIVQDYIYNSTFESGVNTGDLAVEHVTIGRMVRNISNDGTTGGITVSDSTFLENEDGSGIDIQSGNNTGDITVTNSNVKGQVYIYTQDGGSAGDISITNSTVEEGVRSEAVAGIFAPSGSITIVDSSIGGRVVTRGRDTGEILIANSTIEAAYIYATENAGDLTINESSVRLSVYADGAYGSDGSVTLTDSVLHNENEDFSSLVRASGDITITRSTIEQGVGYYRYSYGGYDDFYTYGVIATENGHCEVTDSTIVSANNAYGAHCATLSVHDAAPELSVTPLSISLKYKEEFNPFSGTIEADDIKDGDISNDVIVIGEVGQEGGTYELIYSVTDQGTTLFNLFDNSTSTAGPSTASTTRTITRGDKPPESTSIGVHKERKEKQVEEETALSSDTTALIETLRTTLEAPGSTNDPEALKQVIDLVRQLIVALLELLAAQGKVK